MNAILLLLGVAAVALSTHGRRPLLRLPRGAPVTGSYIVVLKSEASDSEMSRIVKETALASQEPVVVTKTVGKTITGKLSTYMLERVS